jgi:hypothetical protein
MLYLSIAFLAGKLYKTQRELKTQFTIHFKFFAFSKSSIFSNIFHSLLNSIEKSSAPSQYIGEDQAKLVFNFQSSCLLIDIFNTQKIELLIPRDPTFSLISKPF